MSLPSTPSKTDLLTTLYEKAATFNEDSPVELARQIETYAMVLHVTGQLYASSVYNHGKAYSDRKAAWGRVVMTHEGTGIVKEAAAELYTAPEREAEARAEAAMRNWEKAYDSLKELINAKKKTLEALSAELRGG